MRKTIAIPVLALLMMASVLALAYSIRATDGTLNYIGADNSFSFYKGHFSAWSREAVSENNGEQGLGGLQVIAVNTTGARIVLNLHLKQKNVIVNNVDRLYVNNEAHGTYWKKGLGVQHVNLGSVRYDYYKNTGILNIAGESENGFEFRITGMNVL